MIYRDPEIACLSPMPLRARTMPPALPPHSEPAGSREGDIAVININDGLKPWPQGTVIKALRVKTGLAEAAAAAEIERRLAGKAAETARLKAIKATWEGKVG